MTFTFEGLFISVCVPLFCAGACVPTCVPFRESSGSWRHFEVWG